MQSFDGKDHPLMPKVPFDPNKVREMLDSPAVDHVRITKEEKGIKVSAVPKNIHVRLNLARGEEVVILGRVFEVCKVFNNGRFMIKYKRMES